MTETATTLSVLIEKELPHPPEKVWRALTQSALIQEWLMENDFEPVAGRNFTLRMAPMPGWNGVTDCEVLTVEPLRTLSYSWNSSGEEASNGLKTVVTWTLTPTDRGVLLRMEHTGFREDQTRNYQGARYGWERNIDRLEAVVAKPQASATGER